MKRFTFRTSAFVLLMLAAVLPACKKYLSPSPLSTIDPSVTFGNLPNAMAALNGAYLSMAGDFGYGIRVSYYYAHDDDAIMGGGSGLDQLRHQEAHYTLGSTNTDIGNTFNQFYKGIEAANNCIYFIPKMPQFTGGSVAEQKELRRMLGEALVIRAQYYFELIRIWGDVPEQRIPSAFVEDLFLHRTDRDVIYQHLLDDLAYAKTLMPWLTEVSRDERFTKGTAMALRAKIALFAGGYSLRMDGTVRRSTSFNYLDMYKIARAECDTLMQNRSVHTLYPSFKGFWKDVVDAHKPVDPQGELIMQVAMANGTNSDSKIGAQSGTKINGVGGSLGNMLPIYFYQFDSTDVRRDVTFVPFEVVRDIYGRGHASNSIYDGKFRRDWVTNPSYYMSSGVTTGTNPVTLTPASNASIQNFQLNWPLIRFADVLLMFAEADNELSPNGPSTAAINAWKEVNLRAHAGVTGYVPPTPPADHDGFFRLLVRERHLEFGGEGIRKYDLIRWNLLNTAISSSLTNLKNFAAGTALVTPSYMYLPPEYSYLLNGVAGAGLPQQMWFYQNMPAENGSATKAGSQIWVNSFYYPSPAGTPLDPTNGNTAMSSSTNRINWFKNANVTTTYVNYYGAGFVTGKSELYPIPQAAIDANPNLAPQNPKY